MDEQKISPEELIKQVDELKPWFHNYEFPGNVTTNPNKQYYQDNKWNIIESLIPDKLHGKCLDVGCSSGYFSFKMKEKGADYVFGIDDSDQDIMAITQANFAKNIFNVDNVEFKKMNVYESENFDLEFDYTFFLGVFNHIRHPLLALDILRKITNGKLILQAIVKRSKKRNWTNAKEDLKENEELLHANEEFYSFTLAEGLRRQFNEYDFPRVFFIEGELDNDPSLFYIPNIEGITALVRFAGFTIEQIKIDGNDLYLICS